MLGARFPPPPPPSTQPAPDSTRLGCPVPAEGAVPSGAAEGRRCHGHGGATPPAGHGARQPARWSSGHARDTHGHRGYLRSRADTGLPTPRRRRHGPVTPRSALLPRAGAGKGGERRENGRAVPWKRNRGCGGFLPREEGAVVEVARRGPRWPEAPAAAAREDAAGGSGGASGPPRPRLGGAREEAGPGPGGGRRVWGSAWGLGGAERGSSWGGGGRDAVPGGVRLLCPHCGTCLRGAAPSTAPVKVPAGAFLRSPGSSSASWQQGLAPVFRLSPLSHGTIPSNGCL